MKSKVLIGLFFLLISCLDEEIISFTQQLEKDKMAIDQYLADHNITNAIYDASGIRLVISTVGTAGLAPNAGNDLKIKYTGKLLSNGNVFDSNTTLGKLGDYIFGWREGLKLLPEGSIATLYIPSGYGYGSQGNGTIPPNSNLIFDVELQSVTPTAQQESKLASDGVIIDNYLVAHNFTGSTTDPSGLRYEILSPGTGTAPGLYSEVRVNYVGKFIPSDEEFSSGTFESSTAFSSRVINFWPGWHVGLPLLREGGKMRLYMPSILGNGNVTVGNIPANSNLFFEIELVDVVE